MKLFLSTPPLYPLHYKKKKKKREGEKKKQQYLDAVLEHVCNIYMYIYIYIYTRSYTCINTKALFRLFFFSYYFEKVRNEIKEVNWIAAGVTTTTAFSWCCGVVWLGEGEGYCRV